MTGNGFSFGPLNQSSPATKILAGSLVPVSPDAQVHVMHVPVAAQGAPEIISLADHTTHLLVRVENGASVEIALRLEGSAAHHVVEVILGDEARCTLLTLNAAEGEQITIRQRGMIGSGSVLRWQNVTLAGAKTEHDLISTVGGADSESAVDWMFYAKGTESQKLTVRNVFNARNGRGEILMRGIAEQKGHTECKGMIEIGLNGGGTNTYLTQEVLMLDSTSKVDAVPALEIKTNDVKASHSATIARVTEEDLFYFGARGIAPQNAREMFVLGFLGDITARITQQEVRDEMIAAIEEKYSV